LIARANSETERPVHRGKRPFPHRQRRQRLHGPGARPATARPAESGSTLSDRDRCRCRIGEPRPRVGSQTNQRDHTDFSTAEAEREREREREGEREQSIIKSLRMRERLPQPAFSFGKALADAVLQAQRHPGLDTDVTWRIRLRTKVQTPLTPNHSNAAQVTRTCVQSQAARHRPSKCPPGANKSDGTGPCTGVAVGTTGSQIPVSLSPDTHTHPRGGVAFLPPVVLP
jgi:hypothetical protein